jgi:creatinine amidohydrolase
MSRKTAALGTALIAILAFGAATAAPSPQTPAAPLSVHYEELTAPDFVRAVERSGGTCVIPLGIMEKHGAHLPLGTDLIAAREVVRRAAEREYTIVFPPYYFGQIFEARHQPGTLAYSERIMFDLLAETCAELSRNGIKKVILYNGHGGNNSFLPFFCQAQLASPKDYVVYLFAPPDEPEADPEIRKLFKTDLDMHAGERETSEMLELAPRLVHLDRARDDDGADLQRLAGLTRAYTAIWWYARFPNHYAGDGSAATPELGRLLVSKTVDSLVAMIKEVKADTVSAELQKRFFESAAQPVPVKK